MEFTMNVTTAIETRRSIKAYDPTHRMSEAEVSKLMSLAMLAPTAFNIQHWRFVIVEDAALRAQIQAVSWNQSQVTEASLLVVLVADVQAWAKQPRNDTRSVDT
jgi:nitroreductase